MLTAPSGHNCRRTPDKQRWRWSGSKLCILVFTQQFCAQGMVLPERGRRRRRQLMGERRSPQARGCRLANNQTIRCMRPSGFGQQQRRPDIDPGRAGHPQGYMVWARAALSSLVCLEPRPFATGQSNTMQALSSKASVAGVAVAAAKPSSRAQRAAVVVRAQNQEVRLR